MPKAPNASTRICEAAGANSCPKTVVVKNGARMTMPMASTTVISVARRKTIAAWRAASLGVARVTSGTWASASDVGRKNSPSVQATATE